MIYEIRVIKNFAKSTWKHLCQSLNLMKKELWQRYFSVNFEKYLTKPFFTEDLRATASVS